MAVEVPKTMRAVVEDEKARWGVVRDIPVPEIGDNEVLVKVAYVAQNPTDWKHAAFISLEGVTLGCDFSGEVVKVGPNLKTPLEIGDKIAGIVHGGIYKDRGSFAEYLRAESDLVFKVPEQLKLEEAATFGIGWGTAGQVIIHSQGHEFPPSKVNSDDWYLIYGASSSVGLFAVQLAKLLGYKVLAFASPHSFDLVKSYGADHVVDYHDEEKAIKEALEVTGAGAKYGLDTISSGNSYKIAIPALGEKGVQLNAILPLPEDAHSINPKIKIARTLLYTVQGREFNFSPRKKDNPTIISAAPADRAFGVKFFGATPEFVTKYGIKSNPVAVRGGLDTITDGFEELKANKVSGQKLVHKIA
ncbi:uncharacterized protein I303_104043 [Kwoniella dejecticola CBS 10117]|uniref:Enoyl reductase (ER) domain-containing protein n=1 Tax=Kwoniella dejecticola CBS 10117 TaxID=1296121 RepID=A0A1A6A8F8_9TREE|nr:uncharacterized protein I303_04062 [Kwoniella dejecticola CBS 10117]OBR86338.1 hypothetical protein I303_04062 [Kwoniella dejecticola CBS 10117]